MLISHLVQALTIHSAYVFAGHCIIQMKLTAVGLLGAGIKYHAVKFVGNQLIGERDRAFGDL